MCLVAALVWLSPSGEPLVVMDELGCVMFTTTDEKEARTMAERLTATEFKSFYVFPRPIR